MRRLFLILLLLLVPALSAFRLIGPGGQYMSSQKDSKKGNVAALYGTGPRDRMIELEAGYYTLRYNCDDGLEILLISSKGVERGRFVTTGDDRGGMTWHVPEDGWYTLLTNGTSYRVDMDHGIYTPPPAHIQQAPGISSGCNAVATVRHKQSAAAGRPGPLGRGMAPGPDPAQGAARQPRD